MHMKISPGTITKRLHTFRTVESIPSTSARTRDPILADT